MTRIRDEGEGTPLGRLWGELGEQAGAGGFALSAEFACAAAANSLGLAGACLLVVDADGQAVSRHATGDLGARLAELAVTVGEGPVAEVLGTGIPVFAADLDAAGSQRRWPLFAPLAVAEGVSACYVLPLAVGAVRAGVLVLYGTEPAPADPDRFGQAILYADVVLYLLVGAREGGEDGFPIAAPEVHQATGMIAAQLDVAIDEAFACLRARAFADGRRLADVAADVVARRLRFGRDNDRH